jgi:hypothetical protein
MYFKFAFPNGEICLVQTHTPANALTQRASISWFADPSLPRLMVSYVVGNWVSQANPDIEIWENKVMAQKPVLIKEDGPVMALRRWLKQFYSDSKVYESKKAICQSKVALEW